MDKTAQSLTEILPEYSFKRGCFLLSIKDIGKYWLDLYGLSHLFNASENSEDYKSFLCNIMDKIISHQINCPDESEKINSVIVPRWTRCTEDLFSETLLNVCYELFRKKYSRDGIRLYELFSAGGNTDEYYLSKVYPLNDKNEHNERNLNIRAVAFLALDIHSWLIDDLIASCADDEIKVSNVIAILGRCGSYPRIRQQKNNPDKESEFLIYPLFNASGYEPKIHKSGFSYLLDKDDSNKQNYPEKLYSRIFGMDKDKDRSKKFIPIE